MLAMVRVFRLGRRLFNNAYGHFFFKVHARIQEFFARGIHTQLPENSHDNVCLVLNSIYSLTVFINGLFQK